MPINSFLYPGAKFIPPYEVANSVRYNGSKWLEVGRNQALTLS